MVTESPVRDLINKMLARVGEEKPSRKKLGACITLAYNIIEVNKQIILDPETLAKVQPDYLDSMIADIEDCWRIVCRGTYKAHKQLNPNARMASVKSSEELALNQWSVKECRKRVKAAIRKRDSILGKKK